MKKIAAAAQPGTTAIPADRPDAFARAPVFAGSSVVTIVTLAAVLYVAKDVLLPLALAMLIAFALSPLVTRLRRIGLPQAVSVFAAVFAAFIAIGLFALLLTAQITQLVQQLPSYQPNIIAKLETISSMGDGAIMSRFTRMIAAISSKISSSLPGAGQATAGASTPVTIVEPTDPLTAIESVLLPLFAPVAMTGLVIVVVVFMLMQREDLRDRFIRLVGARDLARTTQLIEDAGSRVASYLLAQLLVNIIYAAPIGLGLWLVGIPNPLLWALITLVLRFVLYIGSILSAAFPLMLAFAVVPGWSAFLWTGALFAVVEFVTSNAIEPRLYGSRTGVSPLAIVVAAVFWTFTWGPLGLVLSTPLTVCLVALGRHIPQFALFDILFGDKRVLAPRTQLYQRLLAGDDLESTARAEEALEDTNLIDFLQDMFVPALLLAQDDRDKGMLGPAQEERFAATASSLLQDLSADYAYGDAERGGEIPRARPDWPADILCVGGRWPADDISAAALAQAIEAGGGPARTAPARMLAPARLRDLGVTPRTALILCFLDPSPSRASLLHVRRLKRAFPDLRIGVLLWAMPPDAQPSDQRLALMPLPGPAKLAEARTLGADFTATTIAEVSNQLREPAGEEAEGDRAAKGAAARRAATRRS